MKTIHVYDFTEGCSTIEEHCDGPDVFRKILNPNEASSITELTIAKMLLKNPLSNVVKIYDVKHNDVECYIDMELLNDNYVPISKYADDFKKGLQQLHSIGVVYIDIKSDNIGYSEKDGVYKVFDFNCSGIVDSNCPKQWFMQPWDECYMYDKVKANEVFLSTLYELDMICWKFAYGNK